LPPTLPCHNSIYSTSFNSFFFYCYAPHRDLHSFPTRRSSDLAHELPEDRGRHQERRRDRERGVPLRPADETRVLTPVGKRGFRRSEEHTSELQSRSDLVCRLLLEKKKKKKKQELQQTIEIKYK